MAGGCVAVIACAAGMMCKEIMIVTPLLAMLYDWIFLPRRAGAGIWTHAAAPGIRLDLANGVCATARYAVQKQVLG